MHVLVFCPLFYLILCLIREKKIFSSCFTISSSQRWTMIYLMDLEMGRTTCEKHVEDIDNCPLQEGPGEKKV